MKYVMLQDNAGGRHPVLFHDHLTHSLVARGVCHAHRETRLRLQPVSAGFYDPDEVTTTGRSESLDMDSEPYDALYIALGGAISHMPPDMIKDMLGEVVAMVKNSKQKRDADATQKP